MNKIKCFIRAHKKISKLLYKFIIIINNLSYKLIVNFILGFVQKYLFILQKKDKV